MAPSSGYVIGHHCRCANFYVNGGRLSNVESASFIFFIAITFYVILIIFKTDTKRDSLCIHDLLKVPKKHFFNTD